MEEKGSKLKRILHWILHEIKLLLIVTATFWVFELIIEQLHLPGWEKISKKTNAFNQRVADYAIDASLLGLINSYSYNINNYRYDWHWGSWSSPFNLSTSCREMIIKLRSPDVQPQPDPNANILDQIIAKQQSQNPASRLHQQPEYLQTKCNCTLLLNNNSTSGSFSNSNIYNYLLNRSDAYINEQEYPRHWYENVLAIPDACISWFRQNWNNQHGNYDWPGRVTMILVFLCSVILTGRHVKKEEGLIILLPFVLFWYFLVTLFYASFILLAAYVCIALFQHIGNGIYNLTAMAAAAMASKGFFAILLREALAKSDLTFKEWVGGGVKGFGNLFLRWKK